MKSNRLFLALAFIFQIVVLSAQNPVSSLTAADVDRFIKTAKPMQDEWNALGYDNSDEGGQRLMEAMQTDAKVIAIIKKHGWDVNTISIKWMAISLCYGKLKMDEQLAMMPEEQQKMMKQMMKESGQDIDAMVNAEDLKLVKAKMAQLDALMMGE